MTIEKIPFEAVPQSKSTHGGATDEGDAIRALQPGEAIKIPCRWEHNPICGSSQLVSAIRRRDGLTLVRRCKDGFVYVGRPPIDTEGE